MISKRTGGKMKYRTPVIVIITLVCTFSMAGCYYDKEKILYPGSNIPADCTVTPSKFAADVQPLIISKCATQGCHDAGGASGGVILQSYQQVSDKKDRINTRALVDKTMPPSGPLTPAEAAKIKCWIDAGGLNN